MLATTVRTNFLCLSSRGLLFSDHKNVFPRSLQGLDNIAADGATGFQTIERIVDDLEGKRNDRERCAATKRRLREGKRHLKTDYQVHCREESSPCKDHCWTFAFSDPSENSFQDKCDHEHDLTCNYCEDHIDVLNDVNKEIIASPASKNNKEFQHDLMYDFEQAKAAIIDWNAHVIRSVSQDRAKHDTIRNLNSGSVLVAMDWAMKFVQIKYREKQSEWYGKRGLSWHVFPRDYQNEEEVEVETYAHLFDSCTQDWFAVCSIFENLLKNIVCSRPSVSCVVLRSDEAGCYYNSALIASLKDVGKRLGVVKNYDYSEPTYGKDVCDRILCPVKIATKVTTLIAPQISTLPFVSDLLEA